MADLGMNWWPNGFVGEPNVGQLYRRELLRRRAAAAVEGCGGRLGTGVGRATLERYHELAANGIELRSPGPLGAEFRRLAHELFGRTIRLKNGRRERAVRR